LLVLIAGGLIGLSSYQNQGSFGTNLKTLVDWNANIASSPSYQERADQVTLGRQLLDDKQPLGIGIGGIGPRVDAYPKPANHHFVALNSEGLELMIQAGYIGFLLIMTFYIVLLGAGYMAVRNNMTQGGWVAGLTVAVFATLLQAQTFSGIFLTHRWVTLGLLAGLLSGPAKYKLDLAGLRRLFGL
jgi:O-antigen ligase